jgi:hypothetical protein
MFHTKIDKKRKSQTFAQTQTMKGPSIVASTGKEITLENDQLVA